MTQSTRSLRQRLFVLILLPLVIMAVLLGYWRYSVAQDTADKLFDRSLLAAALAISRDVAVSDGDALLPSTRSLIREAAVEEVFYHVSGPGGAYVTGYAYPPVPAGHWLFEPNKPQYFEGVYKGELVRVIRMTEHTSTEYLSGDTTVTVWQLGSARVDFARQLAWRAVALIVGLLTTLAVVVSFAVQTGLRPLLDLQDAIASRSPDDLSTIKRPIPVEAQGIVATLNRLFEQVVTSLHSHQAFISDAAHQLRNPAAAVLSMAEAVRDANTDHERELRVKELISAAYASSRVADQLLSLDRLRQGSWRSAHELLNLNALSKHVCADLAPTVLSAEVGFALLQHDAPLAVLADRFFVSEVIKNLVDNALVHGGGSLREISVKTWLDGDHACVTVVDDGAGLRPEDQEKAFSRFGQLEPSSGSGLGLAIAHSVADAHGGALRVDAVAQGASITLALPLNLHGPQAH